MEVHKYGSQRIIKTMLWPGLKGAKSISKEDSSAD
jgi:hypothetical protein